MTEEELLRVIKEDIADMKRQLKALEFKVDQSILLFLQHVKERRPGGNDV